MAAIEITHKAVSKFFVKKRQYDAHKGMFGRLLIIAGSKGMAGAAILCARAALRSGVGLVTLSVPDELFFIVQTSVPEATCIGRRTGGALGDRRNAATASLTPDRLSTFDTIAIGPGLGVSPKTQATLSYVMENYGGKLVLDADALNIIAGTNVTLDPDTIITPHVGEAARLIDTTPEVINAQRESAAAFLAQKFGCTAVLKGAGTIVAAMDPAPKLYINTTGNPGMATGGSGDVLTGVVASFMAQGMNPQTAACAAVYVHGYAGDLAAGNYGEDGLIAGDLPMAIALTIKELCETSRAPG